MSFPEIVSVVKDIVTIITLVVGAGITVYGVNTWRKQLTAKAEYDLAKRILNAVNNVRDELFLFAGVLSSNREFSQETYTDLNRNLKKSTDGF